MPQNHRTLPSENECPHCQRSFARLEHLQRHIRTRVFNDVNRRTGTLIVTVQTPKKSRFNVHVAAHSQEKIFSSVTDFWFITNPPARPTLHRYRHTTMRYSRLRRLQELPH